MWDGFVHLGGKNCFHIGSACTLCVSTAKDGKCTHMHMPHATCHTCACHITHMHMQMHMIWHAYFTLDTYFIYL